MSKDEKAPSADEIIEALALEMGVDEDDKKSESKEAPAKKAAPPPLPASTEVVEATSPAPADEPPAAEPPEPQPDAAEAKTELIEAPGAPAPEPKKNKKRAAKKAARVKAPRLSKEARADRGVEEIFNVSGKQTDAYVKEYYDDADDFGSGGGMRALLVGLLILGITAVGLIATYLAIPEDKREDVPTLAKCYVPWLECVNIQEQRAARREAEERRRHQEWLDSLPKYGGLTVRTNPSYALFQVDDFPSYIAHPSQEGALVETRSGTTYENLDVTQPHVVTVTMPNFAERRIEVSPWGNEDTIWQQHGDTGSYYLELNKQMDPAPEAQLELSARMTPSPLVPELTGAITVSTEPVGAKVYYNGRLLVGEDGAPLVTPVTFNSYPPPAHQPDPETGVVSTEPQEPLPVTLSREGVPIKVELDGYMTVVTGVYRHMFTCQGLDLENTESPFWEQCTYVYDTGLINLMTPQEFAPAEAEGSGQAAETAEAPASPG